MSMSGRRSSQQAQPWLQRGFRLRRRPTEEAGRQMFCAPFANDYGAGAGLPPPMPRQSAPFAQDGAGAVIHGRFAEHQNMSSNAYACGGNQNCGNVMTNRRTHIT
eukprot:s8744_g2.t1